MTWLLDTASFVPRARCGAWTDWLIWASIAGDAMIACAYFAMPLAFVHAWKARRNDMARPGILLLFASFIFLCGGTHVDEIAAFRWPAYRFFIAVKIATGGVSLATAYCLFGVIAHLLKLPSREYVHAMNGLLQEERIKAVVAQAEKDAQTREMVDGLEARLTRLEARAWTADQQADIAETRALLARIRGEDGP